MAKRKTLTIDDRRARIDRMRDRLEREIKRYARQKTARWSAIRSSIVADENEIKTIQARVPKIAEEIQALHEEQAALETREKVLLGSIEALKKDLAEEAARSGDVEVESV